MQQNIAKLCMLNFLAGTVFWYPIEKLFLQHIHVDSFGVSINAAVFLIVLVLFDVPSGVLADKWSRKYTLALAFLALTFSSLIGGCSHSLIQYLPMDILLGAFVVLTSGTFQAIMYDTLRDLGRQKSYDKYQGQSYALFFVGLGVSSVIGGYLAQWYGYPATYLITALVMFIAFGITFSLVEPRAHQSIADRRLIEHVKFSVAQIRRNQILLQLTLFLTVAGILRSTQNEYSGLLFIALGFSAIPIGYASAVRWLVSSVGQIVAPKIGRRALSLIPLFFLAFTAFSLIQSRWALGFFYAAGCLYSILSNQAEAAVQDVTPSEIRATTLSLLSFTSNIILIPLSLIFGLIAQNSSIYIAYFMISLIGLAYVIAWLFSGRKLLQKVQS